MKNRGILMIVVALLGVAATQAEAQQASKQEMIPSAAKHMGMMAAVVPVSDVDRAVAFYTRGMGLTPSGSGNPPGETPLYFPGGGAYVMLMKPSGDAPLAPRTVANRMIFAVPDLKALDAQLTAAGYHFNGTIHEIAQYHIVQAMVQDPDGNYIELVQRTE